MTRSFDAVAIRASQCPPDRLSHEVSVFDDLSGDPPPYMAKRNTIADPDCNGWFSGRRLQQLLQSALDARQGKA